MSVLSLYIPIISENISESYIIKMFKIHNIGKILRVDFVKNKEKKRREAFIHFDEWFDTEESRTIKADIMDINTKTRFVYSKSNRYWPLLVNKNAHKQANNPKYEILKKSDVKNVYKSSLNILVQESNDSKTNNNKKQKPETYASKAKA